MTAPEPAPPEPGATPPEPVPQSGRGPRTRVGSAAARHLRRTPYLSGLPAEVAVLSAIAFCVALGFGIVAPVIPVFAKEFGVSNTAVGAVDLGVRAGPAGVRATVGLAGEPPRRAARAGHRHLDRRGVQRAGGAVADLPAAAGPARGRRVRLGDVHRVGHVLADPQRPAGAARPCRRRVPGRLPVRRRRRSGRRWPRGRHLDPGALLRLRRHARPSPSSSGCCSCAARTSRPVPATAPPQRPPGCRR